MILGAKEWQWQEKVTAEAARKGWTIYGQVLRNQRQHDPSVVLVRHGRVLAVWLRATRPRQLPPVNHYTGAGVEAYVWTPKDWHEVLAALTVGPLDDAAKPTR